MAILTGTVNLTDTTTTDVIAAQSAGVQIAVRGFSVTNKSATVATKVQILDGSTVKFQGDLEPGGLWGLGANDPILLGTAATAIRAKCVTTGADVDVNVWGHSYNGTALAGSV